MALPQRELGPLARGLAFDDGSGRTHSTEAADVRQHAAEAIAGSALDYSILP
jgi:hypothetical protein